MTNYTIFIGNPGTGKSTLLNAIVGTTEFRSGVSFGTGLTKILQLIRGDDGDFYGDTPGLSDARSREQAAAEITKALRSGEGDYKLVFVVTDEAGRVRPEDGVTMNLVLDALPKDRKVPYGIIVNKVTKKRKRQLEDNTDNCYTTFAACLNEGRDCPTSFIHLYQRVEELEDEADKMHKPTHALKQFLRLLPAIHIKPTDVQDIRASEFEAQVEVLEMQLECLRNDKQALEKKAEKDDGELKKQISKMKEDYMEELKKDRESKMRELKEMQSNNDKALRKMQQDYQKAKGEEQKKILEMMKEMEEKYNEALEDAQRWEKELGEKIENMANSSSAEFWKNIANEVIVPLVPLLFKK